MCVCGWEGGRCQDLCSYKIISLLLPLISPPSPFSHSRLLSSHSSPFSPLLSSHLPILSSSSPPTSSFSPPPLLLLSSHLPLLSSSSPFPSHSLTIFQCGHLHPPVQDANLGPRRVKQLKEFTDYQILPLQFVLAQVLTRQGGEKGGEKGGEGEEEGKRKEEGRRQGGKTRAKREGLGHRYTPRCLYSSCYTQ